MTRKAPAAYSAAFSRTGASLAGDRAIGAAGGCLAIGAMTFGIYMNVHGPSQSLGTSRDFTIFAQLVPGAHRQATPATTAGDVDLDTTATATIPGAPGDGAATRIIPSISLAAASEDAATLIVDGRARRVRVGDDVPGAGVVVAIIRGDRPMVRTERGLIVPSAE